MSDTIHVKVGFDWAVTFIKLRFGPNYEELITERTYRGITKASRIRLSEILMEEVDGLDFQPDHISFYV